ncbi:mycothiol synthase [Leifsonia sp. NPDC058248]|uniref:mycothiol synthase n=1 Tax=Leifsonia sp. NPDC058248 TaxID=3346402 RepID=UPI0036DC537B
MSDSLRLSVPDFRDPGQRAAFFDVAEAAIDVDGYDPFNEQARLDVESGRRSPIVVTLWPRESETPLDRPVGAAILGRGELDFVIDPLYRGKGFGELAVRGLLATARGNLTAWSHGDHPAARRLAERHGFVLDRTLLHLEAPLASHPASSHDTAPDALPAGFTLDSMHVGADDEEWVELNARIFDTHPEQGRLSVDDLKARQAEPWFDAGDVLMLRDASGRLVGYDWVKVEPRASEGEIYVLGVDADVARRGLGRALLQAGLTRLADRGCERAGLYVEADNAAAVRLYRSAGFAEHTIDVQYRRTIDPCDPFIHS